MLLQPAFLGDVVLSTVLESWHAARPDDPISVLVRKEAASLFEEHPFVQQVYVWDGGVGEIPPVQPCPAPAESRARIGWSTCTGSAAWLARRPGRGRQHCRVRGHAPGGQAGRERMAPCHRGRAP